MEKQFSLDLFFAQNIYTEILQILEIFFSGDILVFDPQLNKAYLLCWAEFEKILHKYPSVFEEIISLGRPIPSLSPASFPDPDNADEAWDHGGQQASYRINDLLTEEAIKLALPHQEVKPLTSDVLEHYIIKKRQQERLWLDMKKNAQKIVLQPENIKSPRFENDTLYIPLNDSTEKSVTFYTKNGIKRMGTIMKILFQHWKIKGTDPLPKTEIIARAKKENMTDINDRIINDTISNIRKAKLAPAELSDRVSITFKKDGYILDINPLRSA